MLFSFIIKILRKRVHSLLSYMLFSGTGSFDIQEPSECHINATSKATFHSVFSCYSLKSLPPMMKNPFTTFHYADGFEESSGREELAPGSKGKSS